MKITRTSQVSGKTHTMDLDISFEQFKKYQSGMAIQYAFPHLSDGEREFILTGITP